MGIPGKAVLRCAALVLCATFSLSALAQAAPALSGDKGEFAILDALAGALATLQDLLCAEQQASTQEAYHAACSAAQTRLP
jgi:hypothetical protein